MLRVNSHRNIHIIHSFIGIFWIALLIPLVFKTEAVFVWFHASIGKGILELYVATPAHFFYLV